MNHPFISDSFVHGSQKVSCSVGDDVHLTVTNQCFQWVIENNVLLWFTRVQLFTLFSGFSPFCEACPISLFYCFSVLTDTDINEIFSWWRFFADSLRKRVHIELRTTFAYIYTLETLPVYLWFTLSYFVRRKAFFLFDSRVQYFLEKTTQLNPF